MRELDRIWDQARADLVIVTDHGDEDVFLWEHSVRTARNAQFIAQLPEVRRESPDTAALVAAALYHDAGWIARLKKVEVQRTEILVRPAHENLREHGASIMASSLAGMLPPGSLKRAVAAIRSLSNRMVDFIEGQILVDADNLDEFGLLTLWPSIRRGALDGKGVQAVIDTWHRRTEYQFWSARINDSFRFGPVRDLARRRLTRYERVMAEVEELHTGADLPAMEEEPRIPETSESASR